MDALQAICDKIMAGVLATPDPTSEEVARAEQRARQERNERLRKALAAGRGPSVEIAVDSDMAFFASKADDEKGGA